MHRCLGFLLVATHALAAQDVDSYPQSPTLFLEKSYLFPASPLHRSLLFEGEAAGHFFIWNNLDWAWARDGGWKVTVPVSMVFSVRMSDTTSEPVRTPSYKIGVKPQFIYGWPEGKDPSRFAVMAWSGGFTHYSNGQQGCMYLGFRRASPNAACVVFNPALAVERRANTIDGDFSTSFLSAAFHFTWGRHNGIRGPIRYQHITGIEFQAHPLGLKPGGTNAEQAIEYGQHVLNGTYEFERRFRLLKKTQGLFRVGARGGHRFAYKDGEDWSYVTIESSYAFDRLRKFGVVGRWHLGSDYYNINFQDTRPLFAIGVMWDPNRIDAFNRIGRPVR